MSAVLGSITVLLDGSHVNLPRAISPPDCKIRTPATDIVLNLFANRETPPWRASLVASGFDYDMDSRNPKVGLRGNVNSKMNAVDYENSSDDENGNGNGFREEEGGDVNVDWETEMRIRVGEFEEMKELVKKAEELQNRLVEENNEENENNQQPEEEKRARVKRELEKVAKEQAERRNTAQLMFDLGQKAYGKGSYGRAIDFLEGALTIIPRTTLFGGEIQIWLAMSYEANNRHTDCIDLYKHLEKNHPSVSIRRQSAELRYILQAPKIKITQEEMVTIPLIGSSYDSYAATWTDKYKDKDQMQNRTTNPLSSSGDWLRDFLVWKPPVGLEKSQPFWVALTLWICLVGAALFLQR